MHYRRQFSVQSSNLHVIFGRLMRARAIVLSNAIVRHVPRLPKTIGSAAIQQQPQPNSRNRAVLYTRLFFLLCILYTHTHAHHTALDCDLEKKKEKKRQRELNLFICGGLLCAVLCALQHTAAETLFAPCLSLYIYALSQRKDRRFFLSRASVYTASSKHSCGFARGSIGLIIEPMKIFL